jgi:hypothetical protein
VHVAGARGATAFVYPVARSKFDASGQTLVCDTMDSRRDKKVRSLGPITFAPLSLQTIKEKVKH